MPTPLKLLAVLAHPDDESMGTGGTLARYAAEGVETYLVTATRGERGWQGDPDKNPGEAALGRIREGELLAAASVLGLRQVSFLDYIDGDLDQADPREAVGKIVAHVRQIRPDVVLSFGLDGAYGHPDHIAVSQFTGAALVAAASPLYTHSLSPALPPHQVPKFYTMALTQRLADLYIQAFGGIVMPIDGVPRTAHIWPDWSINAHVEAEAYWSTVLNAVICHRSQLPGYQHLIALPEEFHRRMWNQQTYHRVYSLVNGGRAVESDLFEGLR